jgi:diguanylate cyclase (GGDEF)-like protein
VAVWHKEVSADIDSAVENPQVIALYQRWKACHAARGATPLLADFDAQALPGVSRYLMLLESVEDDFAYRYYGAEIARLLGTDMTGKLVSAFASEIGAFFLDCYRRVTAMQTPLYTLHFAQHAPQVLTWERLLMPVKDGGHNWVAAYCEPREMRPQLLEAVLNATSDAILALRRIPGTGGEADDWLILIANADFASVMGSPSGQLVGRRVTEAFPNWPRLGLDADCLQAVRSKTDHQREITMPVVGDLRHFSAYFGPLGEGCVVRLADVTTLKRAEKLLRKQTARLKSDNSQLEQLASTDGLTGLFNRRALDVHLEREMAHARRTGELLTLALCDVDHFKAYNDLHGHLAGDDVIGEVAAVLAACAPRAGDMAARFGGEEFVLVLRQTGELGGLEVVHRAQDLLRQRAVKHGASPVGDCVTLSFGVAEFHPARDDHPAALLQRADAALYRAKQNGRNRVETSE